MKQTSIKILVFGGIALATVVGIVIANGSSSAPLTTTPSAPSNTQQTLQATPNSSTQVNVPLSNDNYYTNSSGNQVHSPAYAPLRPPGATAQCRDGTYSFSQHRSGTCSHHGGVAQWLY